MGQVTTVAFDQGIYDPGKRRAAIRRALFRTTKEAKRETKQAMVQSAPRGALYRKRRGAAFIRAHRASARGQRPAIETGNLLNAVSDRRLSDTKRELFIAPKPNPINGVPSSEYAEILQNKMARKIITGKDEKVFQKLLDDNAAKEVAKLAE